MSLQFAVEASTFDYSGQVAGISGFQQYMTWVKKEVIAGHQVTVAVLFNGGKDPQYDHEVTVVKIGTNHAPDDPSYYPDDVLYLDDHGVYTLWAINSLRILRFLRERGRIRMGAHHTFSATRLARWPAHVKAPIGNISTLIRS